MTLLRWLSYVLIAWCGGIGAYAVVDALVDGRTGPALGWTAATVVLALLLLLAAIRDYTEGTIG